MADTVQLCLRHISDLWAPLLHPARVNAGFQHYRITFTPRLVEYIHDLNRLRSSQAHPRRITTSRSLESGSIRNLHQWLRLPVLRIHYHLLLLPDILAGHVGFCQLGSAGLGRSHDPFCDRLLRAWEATLHSAG